MMRRARSSIVISALLLVPAQAAAAEPMRSASDYLSPDMRAEQQDLTRNRAMLWVDSGRSLWSEPAGASAKSCESCHGAPETSMHGVATRYPRYDAVAGKVLNLEGRINRCRTQHQQAPPLAYESEQLLGLTALVALQSRGLAISVDTSGPAAEVFEQGRRLWGERQGQMNLACANCHDANVGHKLRGDTISSGLGVGYPAYRLEWQGLGSLHRRLRACQIGVRATAFPQGAPEYIALELYLAERARGMAIEAPGLRR